MQDLQKIWDKLPSEQVSEPQMEEYVARKSSHELDRFRKILKVELYASITVLAIIFSLSHRLNPQVMVIVGIAGVTSIPLVLYTLSKLNQIRLTHDILDYLQSALKFLKSFIWHFAISVQLVLLLVIVLMKAPGGSGLSWSQWVNTEDGMTTLLVSLFIELFMIAYTHVFYFKRIKRIKSLIEEMKT